MGSSARLTQVIVGYLRANGNDCSRCEASASVTLVQTSDGRKVLVDCGNPWNASELEKALADVNVKCDEITDVVVTHGHTDHCGNLSLFPSANFYQDRDLAQHYCNYTVLKGNVELAPGVTIWETPGHTDHDLSVVVNDASLGTVVVAGDLFEDGEEDKWEEMSRYPEQQKKSREKILEVADWIVPGHGKIFKNPRKL